MFCFNSKPEKESIIGNLSSSKIRSASSFRDRGVAVDQRIWIETEQWSWVKESHSLETHLDLSKEFTGIQLSISVIMSRGSSGVSNWS
ncbi:hypothetical protein PanWU01x14_342630 [Parasponia andersonii]|uniref:Uncharacterized protein n=1 Tax=Parasponia andersonii TaxID=3476 RepID=A0A2P5ADR5_PARAD|nr:hypothetical protein PanWU01x14_342630 [Parasponia andersonii]